MHSVSNQVWKVSKIFVLSHFDFDVSVVLLEAGFLRLLIFIFRYGTEVWPCADKDNKLVAMKVIRHQERLKIWRKMGFIGCFSDGSLYPFGGQDHFRKYANREAETAGFVSLRELFVQLICEI